MCGITNLIFLQFFLTLAPDLNQREVQLSSSNSAVDRIGNQMLLRWPMIIGIFSKSYVGRCQTSKKERFAINYWVKAVKYF